MTTKEFRERLARAEKALEKVPGYWEILEVSFIRSGETAPMRLRIIADGPRSEEEMKEVFGEGSWTWKVKNYRQDDPRNKLGTDWKAIHANGTELAGEWWPERE